MHSYQNLKLKKRKIYIYNSYPFSPCIVLVIYHSYVGSEHSWEFLHGFINN